MAIEQGLTILSWFENLQSKDIPPEYLWEDVEGLNGWFKRMKENDDLETQNWSSSDSDSSSRDSEDDDPSTPRPRREQKMVENDLARALREQ